MPSPRDVLTPEALTMLQAISNSGSFAAAARDLGLVPSALSYRVRQIEDALDVLLFDRSSRQARLTPAGAELGREGARLLEEIDAVAHRVKRIATGWEPQLTIAVDSIISKTTVLELCESFFTLDPPTRIKLRDETLTGTLEALSSGQADLALGVAAVNNQTDIHSQQLGDVRFVYVVAPHHPLAKEPEPLSDDTIARFRAVAVADTVSHGTGMTLGLLGGQDVLTVATMQDKLDAQLRGLGCGFVPECMARAFIETGRLVVKKTQRPERIVRVDYAWHHLPQPELGRALQWWLEQLESPTTRAALLERHHGV